MADEGFICYTHDGSVCRKGEYNEYKYNSRQDNE